MSMQIFDLFGDIRFEGMDQVMSQMTSLGGSLSMVGGSITQFGQTLVRGITEPIIGLIEQGVKYNSTIEDLQTGFEVMLGSEEAAVNMTAKLKEMGAKTPFEVAGLAQATKTLLSYGYTQENVLPIMSKLGDVSLGNNEKLQGLSLVMGQVNSLGRLQAGDLNQLISRGWNPLNEICKRTGETTEQVRDRMQKGKVTYKEVEQALTDATSAGGKFYGGMEKGSQTLSGKLSTLKDNFNEFLGSAVKPISDFLSNVLVPALTNLAGYFNNLSTPVKTMILIFAGVAAVIPVLVVGFGLLISAVGTVITAVGVVGGAISSIGLVIPAVVIVISGLVAAFIGMMGTSEGLHSKVKEVFSGIVEKIKSAANFVKTHIDDIKKAIIGLKEGLTTDNFLNFSIAMGKMFPNHMVEITNIITKYKEFKAGVIEARDKIIDFGKKVIEFISPLAEMFKKTFSSLDLSAITKSFDVFKKSLEPLMPAIKVVAEILGGVLAGAIAIVIGYLNGMISALPSIIGFFTSIWSAIASFFGIVVALFTGNAELMNKSVSNLWESIKSAFFNGIEAVKKFVSGFVNGIVTFFTSLYDTIVGHSIIPDLVNGIINWFNTLVTRVTNFVSNLVSSVINFFSNLGSSAINHISNMVNNVINWFNNLVNQGRNLISNLVNGISNILSGLYGIASSALSSFVNAIYNKVGEAGNAASNVANSVKNAITGIAGSMYSAGTKIIQGVIDGINAMIGKVKGAASSVANAIKGFFPSSPAKEGPLTSIPKWMPTMIDMMTDDMDKGVDKVKKASLGIANAITPTNTKTSDYPVISAKGTTQNLKNVTYNLKIDFDKINDVIKLKNFLGQLQVESITRGGEN